jgi:cell filamentation protein
VTSEGYDAFDEPCAYPGTTVLKNILDLRDPDTLEAFEVEISTLRAEEPLPEGTFDAAHYCAVHHHLFQDVYDWAGQYRTVRTSKGGISSAIRKTFARRWMNFFEDFAEGSISPIAAQRISSRKSLYF